MFEKLISIALSAAMTLSLTACSRNTQTETTIAATTATEQAETSLTGKITAIEGSTVTLSLGSLTEGQPGDMDSQTPPDMSGSDNSQTPPDAPSGSNSQTPPEKPEGDSSQTPPEMPSDSNSQVPSGNAGQTPPDNPGDDSAQALGNGQMPSGQPGGMDFQESGETRTLDLSNAEITKNEQSVTVDALAVDDILVLTLSTDGTAAAVQVLSAQGQSGGMPGGFGGSGEVTQGTSANTISEDGSYTGEFLSQGDDENALRVDGADVTLKDIVVKKTAGSSSNTEDGDFYGMNAALLATNGATVTIENAQVESSAQNGNGVFSYGEGTAVNISNSTITTTADNSGGIQTTGGGTTNASNLTVTTSGNSAAAIRSDRGGGTVNVDGGTYTSNGLNSPAVYSTADITVKNALLTANNSEALVIEGKNSIALSDCTVSGSMTDQGTSSDENIHTVMIYQSMSGDAQVGTSTFTMEGGSLTGTAGDLFYVTNTHSIITLKNAALSNLDPSGALLRVVGNSASRGWGTAGSNGAQVELTAQAQTLEGNIFVDTISTLNLTLEDGTEFTGTVNILDNAQSGAAVDNNAVVTIREGCTWTLTGDCAITSLTNNGTLNLNGYTITLADGTVIR